jgi:hypothetical protein
MLRGGGGGAGVGYLGNGRAEFFGMCSVVAAHAHDLGAHLHQLVAQVRSHGA